MTTPLYDIGDTVYVGSYKKTKTSVVCPDCAGSKRLTVILGDGSNVSIECAGCISDYEGPTGRINQYEYQTEVRKDIISGFEVEGHRTEYRSYIGPGSSHVYKSHEVFSTEAEARTYAEARKVKIQAEYNKRYMTKVKNHRSWAWHVTYHRKEIKRAEKDLAYHQAKLAIATDHRKD